MKELFLYQFDISCSKRDVFNVLQREVIESYNLGKLKSKAFRIIKGRCDDVRGVQYWALEPLSPSIDGTFREVVEG